VLDRHPAGVIFLKQAQQLGLDQHITLVHSYGFVANKYMQLAGSAADKLVLISQKFVVGDELPDTIRSRSRSSPSTRHSASVGSGSQPVRGSDLRRDLPGARCARQERRRPGRTRDALEGIRNFGSSSGCSASRRSAIPALQDNLVIVRWRVTASTWSTTSEAGPASVALLQLVLAGLGTAGSMPRRLGLQRGLQEHGRAELRPGRVAMLGGMVAATLAALPLPSIVACVLAVPLVGVIALLCERLGWHR